MELAAVLSGGIVGFSLGLLGGGGSILATPLLLYWVGISDPHMAIGTSAAAVCLSALLNLGLHARSGNVKWPCALAFAASGACGAFLGAKLGQIVDGSKLLLAFSAAMVGVAVSMLRRPSDTGNPDVKMDTRIAKRIVPIGIGAGAASGFFGIGGGFLIVPGLTVATNMTFINAVGSSLVAVAAFAGATAASYATAGLVNWTVAAWFMGGGLIGGGLGQIVGRRLAKEKAVLTRIFAGVVIVTAVYVAVRSFE